MPMVEIRTAEPDALFGVNVPSNVFTGGGLLAAGAIIAGLAPGKGKLVGAGAAAVGVFLLVHQPAPGPSSALLAGGAPEPLYSASVV